MAASERAVEGWVAAERSVGLSDFAHGTLMGPGVPVMALTLFDCRIVS